MLLPFVGCTGSGHSSSDPGDPPVFRYVAPEQEHPITPSPQEVVVSPTVAPLELPPGLFPKPKVDFPLSLVGVWDGEKQSVSDPSGLYKSVQYSVKLSKNDTGKLQGSFSFSHELGTTGNAVSFALDLLSEAPDTEALPTFIALPEMALERGENFWKATGVRKPWLGNGGIWEFIVYDEFPNEIKITTTDLEGISPANIAEGKKGLSDYSLKRNKFDRQLNPPTIQPQIPSAPGSNRLGTPGSKLYEDLYGP